MNKIITGDCLDVLPTLDRKANLCIVDPPFNIGKKYHRYDDWKSDDKYLAFTYDWLEAVYNATTDTASVYICIGDEYAAEVKEMAGLRGFYFRAWVIWHYTFGVYCESKWGRGHTHILQFSKSPDHWTWNPDAVRVPSDRQLKYRDKRANPKGRVPSDVWTFSRVCGTFKERNGQGHPAQMPEALIERIILASSDADDLVLDPMCGTGTVPAVAKRLNCNYLGIEQSPKYAKAARDRIKRTQRADLPVPKSGAV